KVQLHRFPPLYAPIFQDSLQHSTGEVHCKRLPARCLLHQASNDGQLLGGLATEPLEDLRGALGRFRITREEVGMEAADLQFHVRGVSSGESLLNCRSAIEAT